jgi:predicted RNA-binding protein
MCEANAYLCKDGKEELVLEAVDVLENEGDQVRIANIFGEQKVVKGQDKKYFLGRSQNSSRGIVFKESQWNSRLGCHSSIGNAAWVG